MVEQLPKLTQEFRDFLIEAKQHGYGNDEESKKPPLLPGENGVMYENDLFCYIDRWVGGNAYLGFEQVSAKLDDTLYPFWGMAYKETKFMGVDGKSLRGVMKKVLAQPDPNFPVRGPKQWEDDTFRYTYKSVDARSTLEAFDIEEFVRDANTNGVRYIARFMGGLVNRDNLEVVEDKFWLEKPEEA